MRAPKSAEHRVLTDDELEEHDRKYDCTGVAARWCPIHGDCDCDPEGDGDDAGQWGYSGVDQDGNECPLHGDHSAHAEPER
ncbi:MAG: hypothetical protein IIA27_12535 [Gemmatimonadetes bacterium]|nr:hypothetical protein [Gemmatimonadota bacterium]